MATAVKAPPPAPADTPLGQLQMLCDPGSFRPIRSGVSSLRLGERATPGDGGGARAEAHADTIVRTMRRAGDAGAPVVGFVRSGGARLQEGHAALAGYGRIFRASVELSRKVPQISILSGISAGGGAYSPALTDFVVMTKDSRMFLTGPKVVAEAMGEEISMEELGGPKVHGKNGVAHLIADDAADAVLKTRHLLMLLPQKIGGNANPHLVIAPEGTDPGSGVPLEPRKVYDVRDVANAVLDGGSLLEIWAKWAPNMVTAFARL